MRATAKTRGAREPNHPPPLLMTKLHPPPGRDQTIARERLLERLQPRAHIKVTVIAAPAGYGKTTLLGTWHEIEARRRPVAWVTLDEGDDDPVVLWSHVLEALRRVYPVGVAGRRHPLEPRESVAVLLTTLVNELADQGDVALILDDFHRLSNGKARDSVAWFIEHAPSTLQLVLASRSEPGLPLAAVRGHGELLELRARDLGFTASEADALLNGCLELGLSPTDIERLVDRTEGWPAGLYLAALSLRGVDDREAFVSRFGSKNRHVVDFLVDEVLDAHEPAMRSLMLRSSILGRLSGPLCDAVLEREDSAGQLSELARTNLFLMPLDDDGEWYRFHHLFEQLLRVELEHREPGLAPTLHRRASAWHRDHGAISEAIDHAVRGGAFGEAVEMINGAWMQATSVSRRATILGWLKRLPAELLRRDHRLLLVQAWIHSFAGNKEEAEAARARLERVGWPDDEPLPEGASSLEASLATMRAGFSGGDVGEGYRNAVRAAESEPPGSPLWSAVRWSLGVNCYFRGDLEEADPAFRDAAEAGPANACWWVTASALAWRSLIAGERQLLDQQSRLAEQAITVARERGIEELSGVVHVAVGESLAARGELQEALPALARGVALSRSLRQPLELGDALIRLAALFGAMDRRAAAAAAIAEARTTIDSCVDSGILRTRLTALERSPRRRAPRRDSGLSRRELSVLRMLRSPLSERDIGRELYLSHNTIHSHTKSIYRKLGVSSREQAVQQASALGIL